MLTTSSFADNLRIPGFVRPPFVYYYSGIDSIKFIEAIDNNIRTWLLQTESKIDVELPSRVGIYFSQTRKDFAIQTRGRAPSWAGGMALVNKSLIFVKAPLYFNAGISVEVLTAHEISHIIIHRATNGNYVPKWLSEGLCSVLAGEFRQGSTSKLSRAVLAKNLMGLPRVDGVLRFSKHNAALAYAEASSAVRYYIERFGWLAVRDLLRYIKQNQDFEEAFYLATGVDYDTWQIEWMSYARSRYRWGALLNIDNIIWMLIAIFGSIIVISAYVKKQIQLKNWRDEDDDDWDNIDENPINPQ